MTHVLVIYFRRGKNDLKTATALIQNIYCKYLRWRNGDRAWARTSKVEVSINRFGKRKNKFDQKNGLIRCAKLEPMSQRREEKKSEIKLYGVLFNFGPALNAMNC